MATPTANVLGKDLESMVEREGLQSDDGLSQISKLRISFEIRTPHFPSKVRIWHWTNITPT